MQRNSADVVVIGGGVIGTSVALHLAQQGAGEVLLVEKGGLASGATGRSGSMVREHYLHPVLVEMAMEASRAFHNFGEIYGGDARFQQTGRVLLFNEHDADAARANVAMNRELGVDIRLVTPAEIEELLPRICLDGVVLGAYEPTSGYADPVATTYAFARRAADLGVRILTNCQVTGFTVEGGRLTGLETGNGIIGASAAVAVTGPWTNRLAGTVGESLPIAPTRVQMVHLRRPPPLERFTATVIDQTSGAYYRANAGFHSLMGGEAPEDMNEVVNPDAYGLNADHDTIVRYWERARFRFPDFAATTPLGGYGSLYDMTPDGNPILDESAAVRGLYWAAGFSGHGFKLSPVIGPMMAGLALHGESRAHPLEGFRKDRFTRGGSLLPAHPYVGRAHP